MSSFFESVPLEQASRLINHGPTVLVTSAFGDHRNVTAAAWSMPVEFVPPRVAVVIDKGTYTRESIIASGRFGLCLPGCRLIDLTTRSAASAVATKTSSRGIGSRCVRVRRTPCR